MDTNNNSIAKAYVAMAQVDPSTARAAMLKDKTFWLVARELHVAMSIHAKSMELANNMANSPMLTIRS